MRRPRDDDRHSATAPRDGGRPRERALAMKIDEVPSLTRKARVAAHTHIKVRMSAQNAGGLVNDRRRWRCARVARVLIVFARTDGSGADDARCAHRD